MTTFKKKTKNQTVTTKARVAKPSAKTAPLKAEPAPQAASAKKPATAAHRGSKTDKILDLLKTPRRRHFERARQAYRLEAKLGAWLFEWRYRQENGDAG